MVEFNTVTSWFHHGGQYPVSNYLLRTIRTEQFAGSHHLSHVQSLSPFHIFRFCFFRWIPMTSHGVRSKCWTAIYIYMYIYIYYHILQKHRLNFGVNQSLPIPSLYDLVYWGTIFQNVVALCNAQSFFDEISLAHQGAWDSQLMAWSSEKSLPPSEAPTETLICFTDFLGFFHDFSWVN